MILANLIYENWFSAYSTSYEKFFNLSYAFEKSIGYLENNVRI